MRPFPGTIVTALVLVIGAAAAAQTERDALMALYHATNGAGWDDSANWGSDRPLREWDGVSTNDAGQVIAVRLNGNGLTGRIPPEIASLTRLELLSLARNDLCTLPPELGELANLKALRLSGALGHHDACGASAGFVVPPELGNLTRLEVLHLSRNALAGPIPRELGNLVNLRELRLDENDLTGPIPGELGNLVNLRELRLDENRLTGPIPDGLGRLMHLATLILDGNRLVLPVPTGLVELPNLTRLDLGYLSSPGMETDISDCVQDLGPLTGTRQRFGAWDGSCVSVNYDAGEYARYYNFTLDRAAYLTVDLTSSSVDTWLALWTGAGTGTDLLQENDDGGVGTNAHIALELGAGTYAVEATTLQGGVRGPFTLAITVGPSSSASLPGR